MGKQRKMRKWVYKNDILTKNSGIMKNWLENDFPFLAEMLERDNDKNVQHLNRKDNTVRRPRYVNHWCKLYNLW